jgi:ABC-2 type transport system ATP-binding protein
MGSNDEPAIGIRDLWVRRGGKTVLPGVSLAIRRGVVTGLLGPSGSGKTTLMRAIVGVQIVERGELTVLGRAAGVAELRELVAYVTQAPSIYGDLTVRENLEYFAALVDASRERIDAAIEAVGLQAQAGQLVRTLSGGERSRSSLAAALTGRPELLVLDEPTVGLDPLLRQELWETFHALAADGTTILVSTHVMDEAERCDELVLMREGRIVAASTPGQLLAETGTNTLERAFLALAEAR